MSERKVLNKYYPPDFDPSKIPRMKLARNRQYTVRLMAPFNMRCKTCGEYIYKGKKFNARKEDVEGDDYLGIRIYRFYIKCTRCLQEISFKTDPKNTDYEIEAGATRNFMALKLAEEQAQREEDEEKEEEATNPMKLLEKRTLQSKQELELLESLEELKDLNRRQQTINYDQMLEQYDTAAARQRTEKEQEELDEEYVKSVFRKKQTAGAVADEEIIELEDINDIGPPKKIPKTEMLAKKDCSTSSKAENTSELKDTIPQVADTSKATSSTSQWSGSISTMASKRTLPGIVKKQTSLGVKINTSSVNSETGMEQCVSAATADTALNNDKTNQASESISINADISSNSNKVDNSKNGLSLLGAYSGSSDNDSDN